VPPSSTSPFLRERVLLAVTLVVAVALAWAYLVWMATDMAVANGVTLAHCAAMPGMTSSSAAYVGWIFVMWSVMGVAMMLPTAFPLVLLFRRFWRARHATSTALGPALELAGGYVVAWVAFGLVAALLQWGLEHAELVTPALGELRQPRIGGAVLLCAGLFQLTPLKAACLSRCRSPLMFLNTRWREGRPGPFLMGLDHGLFCLGCCWALMLVMFVAGAMNLLWMAALTVLMLAEKCLPHGRELGWLAGIALLVAGAWLVFAA
jgi:predicted metal-binding membrane protein